jgi:enoyl-CoA hydratase/carnithine racemase
MSKTFETVLFEIEDSIATITLNRPHRLNAFNRPMAYEFAEIWDLVRDDPQVRVIIIRAVEGPAFCSGVDTKDGGWLIEHSPFMKVDPGELLGPKSKGVWKPVVLAIHGMFAGGAFYWLNEADCVICADNAQFFDSHLTFGMVSALEPIGLIGRIGLGEILRMTLMGNDERISAESALRIGLVSEVVTPDALWPRAREIAKGIAAKSPAAVEGSLRAIWGAMAKGRSAALADALHYILLGNEVGKAEAAARPAVKTHWTLR